MLGCKIVAPLWHLLFTLESRRDIAKPPAIRLCYAPRSVAALDSPPGCQFTTAPIRAPLHILQKKKGTLCVPFFFWSGLRGSNPPPRPWQGRALPNELNPHIWCLRSESNQRHEDFQSSALPTELQRHTRWRLGWGSNPRPLA